MRIVHGATVWFGTPQGVAIATVVEIESKSQEQVRLRDRGGRHVIRHILDVYASERDALRARVDQERYWAERYRELAYKCEENLSRIRQRLLRIETRTSSRDDALLRRRDGDDAARKPVPQAFPANGTTGE